MKIKRISCSMGRTINLGQFESLRVDTEFAAQIEEGEDVEDCWDQLVKYTRSKMKEACKEGLEEVELERQENEDE